MGDGGLRHLPGGIDQYVALRREREAAAPAASRPARTGPPAGAATRAARKEVVRLERALDRVGERESALQAEMATSATDHVRLRALQAEAEQVAAERESLEAAWLETAEALEG
jgi:ATP-binding cassette subfamily F protein uup